MTASDDPTRTPGPDGADSPRPAVDRTPQAASPADAATASEPARTERPQDSAPTTGTSPTDRRDADRPKAPGTAPEPVDAKGGGKTATTWIALILGAIVLVLLLIFVIQNNQTAGFEYFSARFDLPLGVAMLLAAIAGALVMALVGSVRMIQMGWTIRKLRKQQEKAQRSLR